MTPSGPLVAPRREPVTRVRHVRDALDRTGAGRPDGYRDIVDFIVRITHRIWTDGDIGLIHDTYHPDCVVHTAAGVSRGVESVVSGTLSAMAAFPELEDHVLNVAWNETPGGLYTSHLGFGTVLNAGDSAYGPATGRAARVRYCADCVTTDWRIHTEWLARDNGAVVRQLGLDLHETGRRLAAVAAHEVPVRTLPAAPDLSSDSLDGRLRSLFDDIWNHRRLDVLADAYAPDVRIHTAGGRTAAGLDALRALHLSLMASAPDGVMTVGHTCWSDETDGLIAAVRWELAGTARRGGWLGALPDGVPLIIPGMTHCRFDAAGRIVEEWTVWDEVAVLARCYRASHA